MVIMERQIKPLLTKNLERKKEKREVDFLIAVNRRAKLLVEAKYGDEELSKSLLYYKNKLGTVNTVQVVNKLGRPLTVSGIQIQNAADWLSGLAI